MFDVTHPLLFASTLPHGLTDMWSVQPPLLFPYLSLLLPDFLFDPWITPVFLVASVSHMSRDVGLVGSSLLHLFWGERLLRGGDAFGWATLYLSLVHTPCHYWRKREEGVLVGRRRWAEMGVATCVSILSRSCYLTRFSRYGGNWFHFTSRVQRCVVSHILVEDHLSSPSLSAPTTHRLLPRAFRRRALDRGLGRPCRPSGAGSGFDG